MATNEEIYDFLEKKEEVTALMQQAILEQKHRIEMDECVDVINVYESDDGLGIILDAYDGDENVATATFWYDDY